MHQLQEAIENFLKTRDLSQIQSASAKLTEEYRLSHSLQDEETLLAYLIVRMPATYTSLLKVLALLPVPPSSILDIGAGPGTTWWAAKTLWPSTPKVTAIEREKGLIHLGRALGSQPNWVEADVLHLPDLEKHEWGVLSYVLSELPDSALSSLIQKCWENVSEGLVIVEPGTPKGYEKMLQARSAAITSLGASVLAPCPHASPCPLPQGDWCHFGVHLERSFAHRYAKLASLPFEEEKFSYVILSKRGIQNAASRILRPPMKRSGHLLLDLCTQEGLEKRTLSKKQGELYKIARRSRWGDSLSPDERDLQS